MRSPTNWLIVIGGFLQDRGKPTGMVRLWLELRKHASANTCIELMNWRDDPREYADLVFGVTGETAQVFLFGYSWGGMTATLLARELKKRGIGVRHMILSDPVFRHWWMLRRWTSFAPWSRIAIPSNVAHVTWFRQRNDWPRGHDLVAQDKCRTAILPATELDLAHVYMDDSLDFHKACHDVCKRLSDRNPSEEAGKCCGN